MLRNSLAIISVTLLLVFSSCGGAPTAKEERINTSSVPSPYRALYSELFTKLIDLNALIKSQRQDKKSDTAFGVELLAANSNRGEALLKERAFKATCLTLDRLRDLGVQSIALSIQYPILTQSFPRSSEYRRFYQRVAQEVRRRGFLLIVEMGTIFHEPEFSQVRVDYRGLTMERFQKELREMAEAIIEDMRPDHLTLFTEPDTHSRNTGLDFPVANFAATVRYAAQGLTHRGVRLGAGAGTWNDMAYFEALMNIPELDDINLHIYPIQNDLVADRIMRVASMAREHQKSVSIGEAWLYKVSARELGSISPVEAFTRDVYSFWGTLDQLFLEMMVDVSHLIDAEFCSFFWMKYLYGYLDYNAQTMNLPPQQLINSVDEISGRRILDNTLNETGERFKKLINAE